jgi:hypothetical protein
VLSSVEGLMVQKKVGEKKKWKRWEVKLSFAQIIFICMIDVLWERPCSYIGSLNEKR